MSTIRMEKEAVAVFRALCKYPEFSAARLCEVNNNSILVESTWSQRCLEKNESHNFLRSYLLSKEDFDVISKSRPHIKAESIWNISSPSGKRIANVKKHVPDKTKPSEENWYFEIWSKDGCCEKVVNLTASEKHGGVYGPDGAFGSLAWNSTEDKLAYVAEKKKPKMSSFFAKSKKSINEKDQPIPGIQFLHREDWGEMLVDKEHPMICVLDVDSEEVTVLNEDLADVSCGQVVWCPDGKGIVFCAFSHSPIRLGIIHCPIRRSILYHYDLESQTLRALAGSEGRSVRSPRFSPDGLKLVYLECESGGPHCRSLQLKLINWPTGDPVVVIDVVNTSDVDSKFQGIYSQSLPRRCWNSNSTHVFFSTPVRSRKDAFAVHIATGELVRISNVPACWCIDDIYEDYILAHVSKIDVIPRVVIGRLHEFESEKKVTWTYLESENNVRGITWEVMRHVSKVSRPSYGSLTYESIILQPTDLKTKALIVFPHGGPHSVFTFGYQIYFASLVKLGFTVALVNYPGSTGYGDDSIMSLLGHIGDSDIKDVQQCAEEVLEKYNLDRERVVVLGGSHGGFITGHLIGQYPGFYKAAVMRNPVTNLVAMATLTDIPDWVHVEAGFDLAPGKILKGEMFSLLYSMSPVAHVEKVKTPTMLMLGKEDRRVPPAQGIEFHKALICQNVHSRLFMYPDNSHPISTIEAESDSIVNIYKWFITHLGE